jgi:L-lysine exporter family protein LysE/ArgO
MVEIIIAIVHGFILALGLIIPLGIQNVFIFNQGATQPTFIKALPSVITASICDTIGIIAAVLGVSFLIMNSILLKLLVFAVGFVFLIYMGVLTWKKAAVTNKTKYPALSAKKQIIFAASVSILNPHAIIDLIAVIGTNSAEYSNQSKIAFTTSCIAVSWIWFFGLAFAGHTIHKFDRNGLWVKVINKAAAILILLIAFYIGFQFISELRLYYS